MGDDLAFTFAFEPSFYNPVDFAVDWAVPIEVPSLGVPIM